MSDVQAYRKESVPYQSKMAAVRNFGMLCLTKLGHGLRKPPLGSRCAPASRSRAARRDDASASPAAARAIDAGGGEG